MPAPYADLDDGEELLLEARPHWRRLTGPVLLILGMLAGCAAVLSLWVAAPAWSGLVALGLVIASLVGLAIRVMQWRATLLVVTSTRIVLRRGVASRSVREVPLDRLLDLSYRSSMLQRVLRAGSITIELVGGEGRAPVFEVSNPATVQAVIRRAIFARPSGPRGARRGPGGARSVAEQISLLADLHRAGALSDAELESRTSELLEGA